jgi:hypothetical protein
MGSLTFCPIWPGISILSISASQVARIIGMSHRLLAYAGFLALSEIRSYSQQGCEQRSMGICLTFSLKESKKTYVRQSV